MLNLVQTTFVRLSEGTVNPILVLGMSGSSGTCTPGLSGETLESRTAEIRSKRGCCDRRPETPRDRMEKVLNRVKEEVTVRNSSMNFNVMRRGVTGVVGGDDIKRGDVNYERVAEI